MLKRNTFFLCLFIWCNAIAICYHFLAFLVQRFNKRILQKIWSLIDDLISCLSYISCFWGSIIYIILLGNFPFIIFTKLWYVSTNISCYYSQTNTLNSCIRIWNINFLFDWIHRPISGSTFLWVIHLSLDYEQDFVK